jgi:hypothetical protein
MHSVEIHNVKTITKLPYIWISVERDFEEQRFGTTGIRRQNIVFSIS